MRMGAFLGRGLVPVAATSPANQAELGVWYDGFDVNGNGDSNAGFANNDPVSTWKNKSTGAATYDASNTLTLRPLLVLSRINAHPAVVPDASNDFLLATANPHTANAARHLFLVCEIPATVHGGNIYEPNNAVGYFVQAGADSAVMVNNGGGTSSKIASAPSAGNAIIEVSFDGVTTNLPTIRINGVDQVVSQNTGTGVGAETQTNTLYIGYTYGAAIGEILAYTALQTGANLTNTRAYLNAKWGIAA